MDQNAPWYVGTLNTLVQSAADVYKAKNFGGQPQVEVGADGKPVQKGQVASVGGVQLSPIVLLIGAVVIVGAVVYFARD